MPKTSSIFAPWIGLVVAWAFACVFFEGVWAANQVPELPSPPDLTSFSLEELMDLDVTSITKNSTELKDVPAAIYVLTAEDIRHAGATNIPEALRMVPGLHVARIDGNKWAVSIRGFNGQFATKLLVLMDGRSLYTPMFSVAFWDQEEVMMEDIDRIEVIRGSGASLWGANAVNGVVNIITKKAKNTQGLLVSAYGGTMRAGGGLRYGADLGNEGYLKVFGRYSEYDQSTRIGGHGVLPGDNSQLRKIGFQFDKNFGQTDKITLQGDALAGDSGGARETFPRLSAFQTPVLAPPYVRQVETDLALSGNYLLGRWQHVFGHGSSTVLRGFWNRNKRESELLDAGYQIDTVDLDFQHNILLGEHQQWVWGLGSRLNFNQTQNNIALGWFPSTRQDEVYSFFAQDEIALVPDVLKLTLGSKFEHNPVTGFEWQPNIRLAWTASARHSVWAAISRSVRTPSWAEQDLAYNLNVMPPPGGGPASPYNPVTLFSLDGNKQMVSEHILAYELGWRGELSPTLTADLALYYYDYDHLCSLAPTVLDVSHIAQGYAVQHLAFKNFGEAIIFGGEASVAWQITDAWKLRASYTHTAQHYQTWANATPGTEVLFQDSFPKNQAMLWSMHQITSQLDVGLNWRFVDGLSAGTDTIAPYHELDARLAWKLGHGLELALVGRNLLNKQHMEFGNFIFSVPTAVQREVYASLRWDF